MVNTLCKFKGLHSMYFNKTIFKSTFIWSRINKLIDDSIVFETILSCSPYTDLVILYKVWCRRILLLRHEFKLNTEISCSHPIQMFLYLIYTDILCTFAILMVVYLIDTYISCTEVIWMLVYLIYCRHVLYTKSYVFLAVDNISRNNCVGY